MFTGGSSSKKTRHDGLRTFWQLCYKCVVVNKVIKEMNREMSFVRDGSQPPTFPLLRAAPAHHGPPAFMKNNTLQNICRILKAGLPAIALAAAGCQGAVSASGSFATPKETVTGAVQTTTNGVTVGGTYQTGATNVGGTITVAK
jgi:hypothetical protein